MKSQATRLFVSSNELREYIDMNYTGFSKILKKFDKVTGSDLKADYLKNVVEVSYPFLDSTKGALDEKIRTVIIVYSKITTDNKESVAEMELRSNLRDHIVMERNTIWKDMIENERRSASIGVKQKALIAKKRKKYEVTLCGRTYRFELPSSSVILATLSMVVFITLLNVKIFELPEQQACFAILVFASMFWALEVRKISNFLTLTSFRLFRFSLRLFWFHFW